MNKTVIALVLSAASFGVLANNHAGWICFEWWFCWSKRWVCCNSLSSTTVVQAKELPDDAWVSLEGHIVK
nr:hypothetical protein [Providencia rustigianii]